MGHLIGQGVYTQGTYPGSVTEEQVCGAYLDSTVVINCRYSLRLSSCGCLVKVSRGMTSSGPNQE